MSEPTYRCGRCGIEFSPEPAYYGGDRLCGSCRDKMNYKIMGAKAEYDKLSREDRDKIDFASAVSDRFPAATTHCNKCGRETDGSSLCSSCYKLMVQEWDEERKKTEQEAKRQQKEFERKMKKIR